MTNPATQKMIKEIVDFANTGANVYPMMFQPIMGRSNTVSAAIRMAKKQGLIVEAGLDGCGKPFYRAPVKAANHSGTQAIN